MKLVEAALAYRKIGWAAIPIRPKQKYPYCRWGQYQKRLPEEAEIKKWWKIWPDAHVGLVTGAVSNVAVLDFDSADALEHFKITVCDLPDTIIQKTGKGHHYFFTCPEGLRTHVGMIQNVDLKAEAGIAILAPSIHANGKQYTWTNLNPIEFGINDLLDMPKEVVEFCQSQKNTSKVLVKRKDGTEVLVGKDGWVNQALLGVNQGLRNKTGARLAGYYLRMSYGDLVQVKNLMYMWNMRNRPPMEPAEVDTIIESMMDRQGTETMGDKIGAPIDRFEVLQYPDGTVRYHMYIEGPAYPVLLTPDDLVSSYRFRVKLMELTNYVMGPIKNETWWRLIRKMLDEATVIQMTEEETNIPIVREILINDARFSESKNYKNSITENAVIGWDNDQDRNRIINVRLSTLEKQLQYTACQKYSRKQLGRILKRIGFEYNPKTVRINKRSVKVWCMRLDEFWEIKGEIIGEPDANRSD